MNILLSSQKLSESFIENNKKNWKLISRYQELSEEFIDKYSDRVYWDLISQYQQLSKEFIKKYREKIDIYCLYNNKVINTDMIFDL